jgi:CheY-like chemotaxis protein
MLASAGAPRRRCLFGVRVLVVDDDEDVRDAMLAILELYGAEVRVVDGAVAARASLAAQPFDVLLSDIEMPHEDGCAFIRSVRSASSTPEIAAAAVTGRAAPHERDRALAAGFDRVAAKPLAADVLVELVAGLAGRRRAG